MRTWQHTIHETWLWRAPIARWRKCLALPGFLFLVGYFVTGLYVSFWLVPLDPSFDGGRYYFLGIPFNASPQLNLVMFLIALWAAYYGIIRGPKTKRPSD